VAPDAKVNFKYSVNPSNYHYPNLSMGSGATALGSVLASNLSFIKLHHHAKIILIAGEYRKMIYCAQSSDT